MGIAVGSTQDELQIKIIWLHNMTDVMKLLSQHQHAATFGDGDGLQPKKWILFG